MTIFVAAVTESHSPHPTFPLLSNIGGVVGGASGRDGPNPLYSTASQTPTILNPEDIISTGPEQRETHNIPPPTSPSRSRLARSLKETCRNTIQGYEYITDDQGIST